MPLINEISFRYVSFHENAYVFSLSKVLETVEKISKINEKNSVLVQKKTRIILMKYILI